MPCGGRGPADVDCGSEADISAPSAHGLFYPRKRTSWSKPTNVSFAPRGDIKIIGLRGRRNHKPLDLCCHRTVSMPARNCRGCIFCGGLKLAWSPCLDLVAQRRTLAVGKCWITRRWRAALLSTRFDVKLEKPALSSSSRIRAHIMVAMGRPGQEPRRIIGKISASAFVTSFANTFSLDAIPDIEHKRPPGFRTRLASRYPRTRSGKNITPN